MSVSLTQLPMQTAPFSNREQGFFFSPLPDGFGYAFNFENPSGVKLLSPPVYSRLRSSENLAAMISAGGASDARMVANLHSNPYAARKPKRLTVWLHVINGCNYKCSYCYIPHLNRSVDPAILERHSMGSATIHPLLRNLLGYCQAQDLDQLRVIFAGGEPTLNLALVEEFCEESSKLSGEVSITYGMISNGSFDAENVRPLLERYQMSLSMSADGYEGSHDRIRFEVRDQRRHGTWSKLADNVDQLLKWGIHPYFLYTVTPSNHHDISRFASFAHDRRLGFRLSLVRTSRMVTGPVQDTIGHSLLCLYGTLQESLDPTLPISRHASFADWNLYQKKYVPCSSCNRYFAIDVQGRVASCQMAIDRTYGNAVTEDFAEIALKVRADPANATLSESQSRNGTCTLCEFFHVCAGGCPQHNMQAGGVMDRPSPWCRVYGVVLPAFIHAVARQLQRAVLARVANDHLCALS